MGNKRVRRVACFTNEQQIFYESLSEKQRRYVDFRGQGYGKKQSYMMAGYTGNHLTQAAHNLEAGNKGIAELVAVLLKVKAARAVLNDDKKDEVNKQLDALALQDGAEKMLAKVQGADGETAKRIQFYRAVANGQIKTVKRTRKLNAKGEVIATTIEEISDIDSRMKARKELDRILGLNEIIDLEKLKVGDITVNIVDASKKEELEDERNKVYLDDDKVEVVDGETVIIETDETQKATASEEKEAMSGGNENLVADKETAVGDE